MLLVEAHAEMAYAMANLRPFPLQHVQLAVVFSLVLPKHTFEADIVVVGAKVWLADRLRHAARAHGTRRRGESPPSWIPKKQLQHVRC